MILIDFIRLDIGISAIPDVDQLYYNNLHSMLSRIYKQTKLKEMESDPVHMAQDSNMSKISDDLYGAISMEFIGYKVNKNVNSR